MQLEIKDISVKKEQVTAICYAVNDNVFIDQRLRTIDGKYTFEIVSIETDNIIYDKPRFKIVLNQCGNKDDYITSTKEAMSCIGRKIIKVND